MYKTGYINQPLNNYIRMKQGLSPQEISNYYKQPPTSNYYPIVLNKKQVCNHNNVYFLNMPPTNYGLPPVPPNELLRYLEAP